MPIEIGAVQKALKADGLDAWLLYDFHGSNPVSYRLAGMGEAGHLATRRWFYLIPQSGEPHALVHAIERYNLDHLPGSKTVYAGREQLHAGLTKLLTGVKRVAMEYSPNCAIPYVSRVDAGTIELIRSLGVDVVSSGDLIQQFEARWNDAAIATHKTASDKLYRIKDQAFEEVARRLRDGVATTEYDIQQKMVGWFNDEGLIADSAPCVSAQENAGNPHYLATASAHRVIRKNELLLLDLWGKLAKPGSVYADITWIGFTGPNVPDRMAKAFAAICGARDAAVTTVQDAARAGRGVRGFEADKAARQVLIDAGYEDAILHRTGHSLGENVHGNGAHLDDYETHDERRLLPGSGFTIEPGLYFKDFGVRTEINMVWLANGPEVTGPRQKAILCLLEE
ncbi:MAG TPA: M24 family metallopeptidase [Vicinamibacterales bacterium]|nr:M24 family metallopeptidase [Vicinamibacterales bacterium]